MRRVPRSRSQPATGPNIWNFPVLPNTRRRKKSMHPRPTFVLWRSAAIYAPSPDADPEHRREPGRELAASGRAESESATD